ncbi:hypothetical protein B0I37DRAFT_43592 [Chaetomium sp. MPI-CAGE-AT-0009]|nr:hypothetical protein B0I37DRAFT_43592 [Chaetomium sp. MPI-CAGE-AT-0009]
MDHHLHGLAHWGKMEAWCFGKDLTCYYGHGGEGGVLAGSSPPSMISLPRRGKGGGGGKPGLKGYIHSVWVEEAFTRALFSFVWMTLFSFVTIPFVDTMYPTGVYSSRSNVMCIDSVGLAYLGDLYNLRGRRDGADEAKRKIAVKKRKRKYQDK